MKDNEIMKAIDEIIIISDYDACYGLTVWYKGNEKCLEVEKIKREYKLTEWSRFDEFIDFVFYNFHCDILLCQDGDIEYFKCGAESEGKG
jgi:hypothetical protein